MLAHKIDTILTIHLNDSAVLSDNLYARMKR